MSSFWMIRELLNHSENETSSTATPSTKTMPVKERKRIRKHLQKFKNGRMGTKETEEMVSHFRSGWEKIKNDYDPKEQENLRNVFNTAYPDLKL